MSDPFSRFIPGTLWSMIVERTRYARACGALQPIETDTEVIEDQGVQFQIRVVSNLIRKHRELTERHAPDTAAPRRNPFLPYERDLFVADVSATHLCLLNKYNVIDHHVLIVTRAYEPQESPLTRADFEALWSCMAEYEALGFYNSCPVAGASQPHRHLQLAPLPLAPCGPAVPIEALLADAPVTADPIQVSRLPFLHAFIRLDAAHVEEPSAAATRTHTLYRRMLIEVGLDPDASDTGPYNLLVTREFMLLVARSWDSFEAVSVNALGFAGSFFVPNPTKREVIRRTGPMSVLKSVGLDRTSRRRQ